MTTSPTSPSVKTNFRFFLRTALPCLIAGMVVAFGGLYLLWRFMDGHEYASLALLAWLSVFWAIFPPLFRKVVKRRNQVPVHG